MRAPRRGSTHRAPATRAVRGQRYTIDWTEHSTDALEFCVGGLLGTALGSDGGDALREHLAAIRKLGVQGSNPLLAEQWDQVVDNNRPDKAAIAEERGVEGIRAERYL